MLRIFGRASTPSSTRRPFPLLTSKTFLPSLSSLPRPLTAKSLNNKTQFESTVRWKSTFTDYGTALGAGNPRRQTFSTPNRPYEALVTPTPSPIITESLLRRLFSFKTFYELELPQLKRLRKLSDGIIRFSRSMRTLALVKLDYTYSLWGVAEETEAYGTAISSVHRRSAERLLDLCKTNGGLYVKVGQYISANSHLVSKEYSQVLKVLQDMAPARPFEVVETSIRDEFGKGVAELFTAFEPAPIAAASVAQVHRAYTKDGREVAVKVQYPEVSRNFNGDMFTHLVMLRLVQLVFPKYDVLWMHDEIEHEIRKELDFINEAKNSERAFRDFDGNPSFYTPKELTTERVLTTEFIHGVKINDVVGMKRLGIDPAEALKKTMQMFAQQMFHSGYLHCDPHPGNIFVRRHPRSGKVQIVLLDHGLYTAISEEFRIQFAKFYKACVMKRLDLVEKYAKDMGIDDWQMAATIVLMRPLNIESRVDIKSGKISKEELRKILNEYLSRTEDVIAVLKTFPAEILFIMRSMSLVRALNLEMGSPVNRFTVYGRESARALRHLNSIEDLTLTSEQSLLTRWREWFEFEWAMRKVDLQFWLGGLYLKLLVFLGRAPETISMEGLDLNEIEAEGALVPLITKNKID